jgi:hypothetical protein
MEGIEVLTTVCRHLKSEARDATYVKLRKAKRAAHTQNCRLRAKLRRAEHKNAILFAAYLVMNKQLREMHERVAIYVQEDEPLSDDNRNE